MWISGVTPIDSDDVVVTVPVIRTGEKGIVGAARSGDKNCLGPVDPVCHDGMSDFGSTRDMMAPQYGRTPVKFPAGL